MPITLSVSVDLTSTLKMMSILPRISQGEYTSRIRAPRGASQSNDGSVFLVLDEIE